MDLYKELLDFLEELKNYREEVLIKTDSKLLSDYKFEYEELRKLMDKSWAVYLEKYPLLEEYSSKIRREESREELREKLLHKSGQLQQHIAKLVGTDEITIYEFGQPRSVNVWAMGLRQELDYRTNEALNACIDYTLKAIGKLESDIDMGIRDKKGVEKLQKISLEPPKAFIAHEGMTRALQKVKDFLDTLGIDYLIAEIEPSNGRVVEEQVEWTKGQADFAIILATKGKIINKETGEPQMGLNVADELGRAREVFKNRIILLLQTGVEPHTNVSGIVYESFTTQYMENVFKKIVKEIRNWGFIRSGKVKEQTS